MKARHMLGLVLIFTPIMISAVAIGEKHSDGDYVRVGKVKTLAIQDVVGEDVPASHLGGALDSHECVFGTMKAAQVQSVGDRLLVEADLSSCRPNLSSNATETNYSEIVFVIQCEGIDLSDFDGLLLGQIREELATWCDGRMQYSVREDASLVDSDSLESFEIAKVVHSVKNCELRKRSGRYFDTCPRNVATYESLHAL